MSTENKELSAFLEQLRARVSDKCSEVTGEPGQEAMTAAFREEGFTQVVLEILEDLGQISGAQPCFFKKSVGRRKVRVNGWNFEEDEAQLDSNARSARSCNSFRIFICAATRSAANSSGVFLPRICPTVTPCSLTNSFGTSENSTGTLSP